MGPSAFPRAAALVAAATLLVAACGDDDTGPTAEPAEQTTTTTTTQPSHGADHDESADATTSSTAPAPQADQVIEVSVRAGEVVGGGRHEVALGDTVAIVIRSDVADEVHVHGYDVTKAVPAGRAVTVTFPADIDGKFEIEMHDSGEQVASLSVTP